MVCQLIGMSPSIPAFPRRTEQEHTLCVYSSTREVCQSTRDLIYTALLLSLPYFSIVHCACVSVAPMHVSSLLDHALTYNFLSTGPINTHFFHI